MFLIVIQAAYQANMAKIQEKLKQCVGKQQAMDSIEKLSDVLGTDDGIDQQQARAMDEGCEGSPAIDAAETSGSINEAEVRGENKMTVSKRKRRRKHTLARQQALGKKHTSTSERPKRKPRFFCEF